MEAGRELDALVAEHALEWKWYEHPTKDFAYFRPQERFAYGAIANKSREDVEYMDNLPYLSTDMGAAWQVVVAMRAKGWYFELTDERDDPVEYTARFVQAEEPTATYPWSHVTAEVAQSASTAPHAICLAALEALGEL